MAEPSLDDMIFGDVDESTEHARDLYAGMPLRAGEGSPVPFDQRPWHEQFGDVASGTPAVTKARSFLENEGDTLLAGTSDEAAAGFATSKPGGDAWTRAKMGPPPGDENTYAAGSEKEDVRRTLAAEKAERDAENPGYATAGMLTGGATAAAAMPASLGAQTLGGAALTGATMMGQGSGPIEQRAGQAVDAAKEHPWQTALAFGAPLLGAGVAKGLSKGAEKLNRLSNRETVAAFMTPAQRTAFIDNSSLEGMEAIERLGGDVRAMGLHKQPWHKFLISPNAETFATNATKARVAAEQGLDASEKAIIAAGDPKINYRPVAEDLEGAAEAVMRRADKAAAVPEAAFMRRQAQDLLDETVDPAQAVTVPPHPDDVAAYEKELAAYKEATTMPQEPEAFQYPGPTREPRLLPGEQEDYERALAKYKRLTTDPEKPPAQPPTPVTPEQTANYERALAKYQRLTADPEKPPSPVAPKDWFEYLEKAKANPDLPPPVGGSEIDMARYQMELDRAARNRVEMKPPVEPQPTPPSDAPMLRYQKQLERAARNRLEMKPPVAPVPRNFPGDAPPRIEPDWDGYSKRVSQVRKNQAEMTPPEQPQPGQLDFETGERNFSDAQADLRYYNQQIDRTRPGGYEGAMMQEQVRRRIGGKLREQIHEGLDDAVGNGQLDADVVDEWMTHKKDYGTAATVEDPAMALMQREYGGSMGLKDLAGASMLSTFGLGGPAALATTKAMQGRWPGWRANQLEHGSKLLQGGAAASIPTGGAVRAAETPIAKAQEQNPGAPKAKVVQSANDSLKADLQEAIKHGTDWFRGLLD